MHNEQHLSKYVPLPNGLDIHYQESGNGPRTVLFVPGWTMTTEVFHRQLDFFTDHDEYKFITLDLRSHGKTTTTREGNTYEQHGRDIHEFVEALALEEFVICGWSFGTLSILSYINQFGSDALSGLIMLDGPPKATGIDNTKEWVTYCHDDGDGSQEFFTMGKLRDPSTINLAFARWMLETDNPTAEEWIITMTDKTPNSAAALLNATANFLDYEQDLIQFGKDRPVWCVVRVQQRQVVSNWCTKNLPSATVSAFGEHMMFWEQSERFNRELMAYLQSVN